LWWVESGYKISGSPESEPSWVHSFSTPARGEPTRVSRVGSL